MIRPSYQDYMYVITPLYEYHIIIITCLYDYNHYTIIRIIISIITMTTIMAITTT